MDTQRKCNLQSYCNFVHTCTFCLFCTKPVPFSLPFSHMRCFSSVFLQPSVCKSHRQLLPAICLSFTYELQHSYSTLLTLIPNPEPLHSRLLTPLLPFTTVKLPFTSPSFPFPLAGNLPSTMPSQTQEEDQIMMDAGVALGPSDFGKIHCSSTCCHSLTQIPRKGMLAIFL